MSSPNPLSCAGLLLLREDPFSPSLHLSSALCPFRVKAHPHTLALACRSLCQPLFPKALGHPQGLHTVSDFAVTVACCRTHPSYAPVWHPTTGSGEGVSGLGHPASFSSPPAAHTRFLHGHCFRGALSHVITSVSIECASGDGRESTSSILGRTANFLQVGAWQAA